MFKLNDQPINIAQDLVIGNGDSAITIPAASLQDRATREHYGITETTDDQRPDDRYYLVHENGDGTFSAVPKEIDVVRALKAAEISLSRYHLEIGGITLPNGAKINTERDAQSMIGSALLRVTRKPEELIDWKGGDGTWVKIDKATVEMIADTVGDHVQACFSAERAKHEELSAIEDFEQVVAFDSTVSLPAPVQA